MGSPWSRAAIDGVPGLLLSSSLPQSGREEKKRGTNRGQRWLLWFPNLEFIALDYQNGFL